MDVFDRLDAGKSKESGSGIEPGEDTDASSISGPIGPATAAEEPSGSLPISTESFTIPLTGPTKSWNNTPKPTPIPNQTEAANLSKIGALGRLFHYTPDLVQSVPAVAEREGQKPGVKERKWTLEEPFQRKKNALSVAH